MKSPYDEHLPILAELERAVSAAAERELGGRQRIEPRRGARSRHGRRIARRTLILVVLALLIGASALAATGAFDGGGSDVAVRGHALDVADGNAGGGYRLVLHPRGKGICRVMVVDETVTARCGPVPEGGEVQAASALGGEERFVFGLTGAKVRQVTGHVGDQVISVRTRPIDPSAARANGIEAGLRFFIASVERVAGSTSQPPAIVNGRADCSLTLAPSPVCRVR